MKYVYVIMHEQYMPELHHHSPYGTTDFVFSSWKQAEKQMNAIVELVNQDKWCIDKGHSVSFDRGFADCNSLNLLRSIKIQHPNGTYTIYTLQKVELNRGYGI